MDNTEKYIGRILDNRYEILELIGTGGMALVYKARCHRLNRYVAIKILKEDLAGDEDFRRRFHTESQAVGMLSHPNIVAVYDVSRSDNIEFIVMELIEGITLKQYINRKGLLNWKEALHFATQVTKALGHAHSRGIIHRDIKPHNIMILKDGSVKVADFGIARLLMAQNTLTQEALGSVHYISPEQAKGGHVDARSDIYSVGVVMYEMLTSRLPFVGESAVSVAIQHISAIPLMPRELNPDIPVGLEDITMHAMEPDLNMRFTTADEMLNDLEEFRKNPSIVFKYTPSEPRDRQLADVYDEQDTRVVQSASVIAPSRRSERGGPTALASPSASPSASASASASRASASRASAGSGPSSAAPGSSLAGGASPSSAGGNAAAPEQRVERRASTALDPRPERRPAAAAGQKVASSKKKPDMTADEYRASKKKAANTSTLVGVFFIVLFLIAVVVFMWNYLLKDIFSPQEREQLEIPDFVNRVYADIIIKEDFVDYYNFRSPEYVFSNEVPEGLIISQSPAAGTVIDAPLPGNKRNIDLTVSLGGEPSIQMPYLIELHFSQARNELDSLGIGLSIIEEPVVSDIEKGYVIRTIPDAGSSLARGNSVTIIYSAGPENVKAEVPDLKGSTKEQLEAAFRSNDITPIFFEYASDMPKGTVIFIEKIGQMITVPASIEVHISAGPEETPSPDPVEEEPSPDPLEEEPTDEPGEEEPPDEPGEEEPPAEPEEPEHPVDPGDTDTPTDGDGAVMPPEAPTPDDVDGGAVEEP
ncbi:MAG: protein kinase [Oscillospiraceae bacterium]|nr:protein kinase [Oscillospiraceae bacterium]